MLHLLLSISLQHSLRTGTENKPVSSPSLSNMPIFGLERTAGHIQTLARHSTPKYPHRGQSELHILHTLALTQVSQTGCGWMFSPHPAQCNYPAKTTVLGFPHSSLPQYLTLPTVPKNDTGILSSVQKCSFSQEQFPALMDQGLPEIPHYPPKSISSLNCCFLLQAEGP